MEKENFLPPLLLKCIFEYSIRSIHVSQEGL